MQVVMDHYARTVPEHQRQVVNHLVQTLVDDDARLARTLKATRTPQQGAQSNDLTNGLRQMIQLLGEMLQRVDAETVEAALA